MLSLSVTSKTQLPAFKVSGSWILLAWAGGFLTTPDSLALSAIAALFKKELCLSSCFSLRGQPQRKTRGFCSQTGEGFKQFGEECRERNYSDLSLHYPSEFGFFSSLFPFFLMDTRSGKGLSFKQMDRKKFLQTTFTLSSAKMGKIVLLGICRLKKYLLKWNVMKRCNESKCKW